MIMLLLFLVILLLLVILVTKPLRGSSTSTRIAVPESPGEVQDGGRRIAREVLQRRRVS